VAKAAKKFRVTYKNVARKALHPQEAVRNKYYLRVLSHAMIVPLLETALIQELPLEQVVAQLHEMANSHCFTCEQSQQFHIDIDHWLRYRTARGHLLLSGSSFSYS
jgi:hypothetical protein